MALLTGIVMGTKASAFVSTVGTDVVIRTLTTTTSSIGSVISYLTTNNRPCANDITNTLTELDLEFTVNVIDSVVNEYEDKELSSAIKKVILGVNDILESIHKELNAIKDAIEYHNSKYFKGWRSFSWTGNMGNIKKHNQVLKSRYQMLLDLLKIYNQK
jgi:hypothetical protein